MRKRIIGLVLTFCLLLSSCFVIPLSLTVPAKGVPVGNWINSAAKKFTSGSGTEDDPHLISTPEQLALMAKNINENSEEYGVHSYKLNSDIDLSGKYWTVIGCDTDGNANYTGFSGVFDGDGHTISNVTWDGTSYANMSDSYGVGFFGAISGGAVIKDLGIVNMKINGSANDIGGLAGYWKKTDNGSEINIQNIYIDAEINSTAGNNIGGYIGNTYSANATSLINISNCVFKGEVSSFGKSIDEGGCIGGYIGNGYGSSINITNCLNLGDIRGNRYVSGFVGQNNTKTTISKCLNLGKIDGIIRAEISAASTIETILNKMILNNCFGCSFDDKLPIAYINSGTLNVNGKALALLDAAEKASLKKDIEDYVGSNPAFLADDVDLKAEFSDWSTRAGDFMIPTGVSAIVRSANL